VPALLDGKVLGKKRDSRHPNSDPDDVVAYAIGKQTLFG
jgi:hypothetical protein